MHPDDARAAGLRRGDVAEIRTANATVRAPVEITEDLVPGAVALPHGWGHAGAGGLSVARHAPGVNPNRLAASGPDAANRLDGMTHLTGILVDVRRADAITDDAVTASAE
jgi:anaerobic selenocysteine-containing dehydrogenase